MTWEDIYGVVHGAIWLPAVRGWQKACDRKNIFTGHENTRKRLRPYERTPLTCLWCLTRTRQ